MKWLSYILSSIWRLWFFFVFIITFILFIPSLFFFTAIIKNNKIICNITRYWSRLLLWFSGIFYKIEYEEPLKKNQQYIFCANHVSTLDIPLIAAAIPIPLLYIGKAELEKIPIFGYFFKHNSVIVNRKKRKDSYSAFLQANEKLNSGLNICVFPEGGIPKSSILLKPFKNGPFKLALENKVNIIPLTLADNKLHFPQEYFKGYPGIVRVKVHKAILPNKDKKDTIKDLNNSTYNVIFNQLKSYEN